MSSEKELKNKEQNGTEKKPKKKGPGRPRKKPTRQPMDRKGIVSKPENRDNYIEFVSDKPAIFRKYNQHFKAHSSKTVQWIFRPNEVIIASKDHLGKCFIRCKINCKELNHYFCKNEISVGLMLNDIKRRTDIIDNKNYKCVKFILDENTMREEILYILEHDLKVDKESRIDLVGIGDYYQLSTQKEKQFLDEDYAIKIHFPGKYFKNTISEIKSSGAKEAEVIQEDSESNIYIRYDDDSGKVNNRDVIKKNGKIKFESNLEEDETLRVSFDIGVVEPVSKSLLADTVTMFIDENKPLMFKANVGDDPAFELKVLADIEDERKED